MGDRGGDGERVGIRHGVLRLELCRFEYASFGRKVQREAWAKLSYDATSPIGTGTAFYDVGHFAQVDPAHDWARRHSHLHPNSRWLVAIEPA